MTEGERATEGPHPDPLPQERGTLPALPDTFLILDPDEHTFDRSRCVVLPVPYEETTSYRKGTRRGPEAIIRASAEMEDYDVELGCEPCAVGIHTAPALEAPPVPGSNGGPGGDGGAASGRRWPPTPRRASSWGCSAASTRSRRGLSPAHAERHPGLSVLFFDAQADLRDDYQGWAHSHACAARRALDHAASLTLVGVRSMTGEEAAFAQERGVALFPRSAEPIADAPRRDRRHARRGRLRLVRPRRVRPVVHVGGRHAGAGRHGVVGGAARPARRRGASPHRGVRRSRARAGRGAGGVRVHCGEAGVQDLRVCDDGEQPHTPPRRFTLTLTLSLEGEG